MSDKIKSHHVERKAILYVRQSSVYQVQNNLESQKLQYARAEQRAVREGSSPSGARMRSAISESGGNASRAGEGGRYDEA